MLYSLALLAWTFTSTSHAGSTDSSRSVVLKDPRADRFELRIKRDYSNEELWDAFQLVRKANSDDPVARQELGLRYLTGTGFPADTMKAGYWIGKAAQQNYPSARYNYAILLNNGWGVDWNPFDAYRHFRYSAERGMVEAEYAFGLLLTDNLIVPRNYAEALHWIKAAADSGYQPAKETLDEFDRRGIVAQVRSQSADTVRSRRKQQSQQAPSVSEEATGPEDWMLVRDAVQDRRGRLDTARVRIDSSKNSVSLDSSTVQSVIRAADAGSPEALTLIGRWYERGIGFERDVIQSSVRYLRAIRYDSPWAPILLWKLSHTDGYFRILKQRVDAKDPDATFVWAGLTALGFDHQLTERQALEMLQQSAEQRNADALVALATLYSSGRWVTADADRARSLFQEARAIGNREAKIRLWMLELRSGADQQRSAEIVRLLRESAEAGSVLAEAVLGYCYQEGKGVPSSIPEALRYYRRAAQRGNQVAYTGLRQMYDRVRPKDAEFQIPDDPLGGFN
jgi:TPR repeat protein